MFSSKYRVLEGTTEVLKGATSLVLASLTSKKTKWEWGPQQSAAFATAKKIIVREVLLAYPDLSKKFVIHTDASHYQLGAVLDEQHKEVCLLVLKKL
jgi:RNase H-like domain found in reverse transcriptase